MILASNRGFAEWGKVFGDPVVATALLDRLLRHAVVVHIEGASFRLGQHADLVPESLRPPQHANLTAGAGVHRKPPLPEPPFVRPAGGGRNAGRLSFFNRGSFGKLEVRSASCSAVP
jgi:hypothetical protein